MFYGDDCSGLADLVMRILSERSPPNMFILATSKPGRSHKAVVEFLDLVILSGCGGSTPLSNRSHTAFVVGLTAECVKNLKSLVRSRGVEEIGSLKLCSGPYKEAEEVYSAIGDNSFSINFRERSKGFEQLKAKSNRRAKISVEVFGELAFICWEKWI
ncbi:hypothetical protein B9Q09_05655 [Candidatus Marsarchaeota G2 archaeon ECH_B_SAG-C16]|uniref:Uncharacterized protein n=1 Tax=Candidatus Marsarchaeota G2 archaeon ECH_B_SAG-C16 TaxID=1978163 RepID=A0A2R6B4H9_9ARCH|nr:MAG: hypothetical protein B9Q09_05655 [Candidatus Marsarchaeota G2 archaeon ECH_B_SAG-C16]